MRLKRSGPVALAVLMTALVASCQGGGTDKAADTDKAGGAATMTLRLGTADPAGRPGSLQVEEFARQIGQRSGGRMRIEPVWSAAEGGRESQGWDQRVARQVVEGRLDLASIPTRAWDTEGVTSLRALQAPFLVTSPDLVRRTISGDLGRTMLGGLQKVDVVGLSLWFEGLRHPFSFGPPLRTPRDYSGAAIRVPASQVSTSLFGALGATVDDWNGSDFEEQVRGGGVDGAETSFPLAKTLPATSTATGNVTLYPKVNSLVAGRRVFSKLTKAQRKTLTDAAAATAAWSFSAAPDDAAAAEEFCREGGRVVTASAADLAALERSVRPVYQQLSADPQTRHLIEAIRRLKGQTPTSSASRVRPCGEAAPVTPSPRASVSAGLDGVYRIEITDADLRAGGVTSAGDLLENHGIYTWRLRDGTWHWDQRGPNPISRPADDGTYTVEGQRVTFLFPVAGGPPPTTFTWDIDARGDLRLAPGGDVDPVVAVLMTAHPWRRLR
ncbi:MAG TPA: TRAP transporter substrate-binding protein DctP [Actinomycetales bacterium]|nr:TRAP transporter substrate-binding protein DctP [Actinomycetales bacterium]